jgi:hypothetical protein
MQAEGAAETVGQTVSLIKDNAARLGLTWEIKSAEVTGIDLASGNMLARYDGDPESIPMVSVAGVYGKGQRVKVLQVPPAGNFIIGSDDPIVASRLGVARFITYAQTVGSTTSPGPIQMPGVPSFTITKAYGVETLVEFTFATTFYGNGGGEVGASFWVRDTTNGGLTMIGNLVTPNGTNVVRQQCAGLNVDLNAANRKAGTYLYQLYWGRTTGTGLLQVDGNDMLTIFAKEVVVP